MKNITKTNVLFTMTVLFYIILVYSAGFIPENLMSVNLSLVLPEVIPLIPAVLYIAILKPSLDESVTLVPPSSMTTVKVVVMTFALIPLVNFINSITSLVFKNSVNDVMDMVADNSLLLNLVILALLPAVVEEFLFRGLIFGAYKKRNPFKGALLSAALFGFMHMNFNQFSYAFIIGFIFAMMVYATGSLLSSILAHFIINGTSIFVWYVQTHDSSGVYTAQTVAQTAPPAGAGEYIILAAIALTGLAVAIGVFYSICRKNRGVENSLRIFKKPYVNAYDESQGKFFDIYLIIGIGICLFYMIISEL